MPMLIAIDMHSNAPTKPQTRPRKKYEMIRRTSTVNIQYNNQYTIPSSLCTHHR